MKRNLTSQSEAGFTLVEIIVVIVIIGVLTTMFGGRVFNTADRANADTTRIKMKMIDENIKEFRLRYRNKIPNSFDDLTSCTDLTGSGCTAISNKDDLEDAWGNPMRYEKSGDRTYRIISLGADGKSGGSGVDADIIVEGP